MIIQLPHFISEDSCKKIIEQARPKLTPAMVGEEKRRKIHFSRVCDNYKYNIETPWTAELRRQISIITSCPLKQVEPVEVIKYSSGGYYLRHHDGAHRSHTLCIYLNDSYIGGDILFDRLGKTYSKIPTGMGLLWVNTPDMTHEAKTVISGEKWLLSVWVRKSDEQRPIQRKAFPLASL